MARFVNLRSRLRAVGMTDTGKVREHNEDAIAWDQEIGLFVLADGMGGYNAGEVASGIAAKTISSIMREAFALQDIEGVDKSTGLRRVSILLRDAIARANKIIYQTSKTQPQCEGMGTTVCGLMFSGSQYGIAHIGDSRGYLLRDGEFRQLTHDHSWVQTLVDEGRITEEESLYHPHRSLILKVLNGQPIHEPDLFLIEVEAGDRIIVGVNDYIDDDEDATPLFRPNLEVVKSQLDSLKKLRAERDGAAVESSLARLREAARGQDNLMPAILESVKTYATLGEMCGVLREEWGEYTPPTRV